jgi:hypothetical protein
MKTDKERIAELETALRMISVSAETAQFEDAIYTTPKQSLESLCEGIRKKVKETMSNG